MIKRINPFIVVGIMIAILLVLFIVVQSKKSSILEQNSNLASYTSQARSLKDLKSTWNSKQTLPKLNSIISNPSVKKKSFIRKLANKIVLDAKGLTRSEVDMVIKKLLNSAFEIKKINIQRVDDKQLNINVEVNKWRY